ncbi:MAG TPA: hypothetical protein ENL34_10590, partial [Chloroflexi bacterium]|nr:hypothetical protein [Chloroflexota bacterium]
MVKLGYLPQHKPQLSRPSTQPPQPPERPGLAAMEDERIKVPDVTPAFVGDGPVAQALGDRYRYRAGQVEMAQL